MPGAATTLPPLPLGHNNQAAAAPPPPYRTDGVDQKKTRSPEYWKKLLCSGPHTSTWMVAHSPHIRISKRLKALPLAVVLVLLFLREKE
jgi:hypothetical protein